MFGREGGPLLLSWGANAFLKFGAEQLGQPTSSLCADPAARWCLLVKFPRSSCGLEIAAPKQLAVDGLISN